MAQTLHKVRLWRASIMFESDSIRSIYAFVKLIKLKSLLIYVIYWLIGIVNVFYVGMVCSPVVLSSWCGVRQGGVLSANLFTLYYVDNIIRKLSSAKLDCVYIGCVMCTDDRVYVLQSIFVVIKFRTYLDMFLNI